jgi:creatinine amidohydrolase/Fe(II)-dependent formamide hydrolase-like protein
VRRPPKRVALAACWLAFLFIPSFAIAAGLPSVFIEELTWTELRDAIRGGATTIIVPIGGTEQNGPHMVLGKHNVWVKALAGRIAQATGGTLVAPVIAYVPEGSIQPPTAHMRFPGTITIPTATFEQMLESAGRSFRLHGFHDVVFIGDHGGYQPALKAAASKLNAEWAATPVRAHAIDAYYRAREDGMRELLKNRGYRDAEIGVHAGLADTSLALAIDPQLVRADRLRDSGNTALGVTGDPAHASAELGAAGVDLVVQRTSAAIRDAVRRH